jgi:hypothetical protein
MAINCPYKVSGIAEFYGLSLTRTDLRLTSQFRLYLVLLFCFSIYLSWQQSVFIKVSQYATMSNC